MPDSDDETIGEQPAPLEQPAPEQSAPWIDARLARVLTAVIVVLGAAAVGYLGSLVWPLAGFSGSKSHMVSTNTSKALEPSGSAVVDQKVRPAEPSAWVVNPPLERQSPIPAPANLADKANSEPSDVTRPTSRGSLVVLNAGTAGQATDADMKVSKTEARPSGKQIAEARREAAGKKKPSRVARTQKGPEAAPANAKSASAGAGLRDPALREFMTTPMRF